MKMAAGLVVLMIAFAPLSCSPDARDNTKVVILGFDGAGWDTIDPLIEAGKLPVLARLKQDAAWGPLETFKPTKSPVIWTSIATGKSMTKHGILDYVFVEKNDIQVPYSNSERREPSIWQILDHFDRRSVVVNWFVTYPPEKLGDLSGVYEHILEELKGQYNLGYVSTNTEHDGKWRRLQILTAEPGTRIRSREGYYAPRKSRPRRRFR